MYRGTTAIFAVPEFPRTILARIGLPLCLRGWGIRPLGVSLVFSVFEARPFRHFLLCASCARVRSPLRRDFDFHRLSLLARRLTTRRTRILTYSLLFFCLKLNTYLQHHHCCTYYPSSKWPLWIVHTAIPSDSG